MAPNVEQVHRELARPSVTLSLLRNEYAARCRGAGHEQPGIVNNADHKACILLVSTCDSCCLRWIANPELLSQLASMHALCADVVPVGQQPFVGCAPVDVMARYFGV